MTRHQPFMRYGTYRVGIREKGQTRWIGNIEARSEKAVKKTAKRMFGKKAQVELIHP